MAVVSTFHEIYIKSYILVCLYSPKHIKTEAILTDTDIVHTFLWCKT